jgi:hypothetical protein
MANSEGGLRSVLVGRHCSIIVADCWADVVHVNVVAATAAAAVAAAAAAAAAETIPTAVDSDSFQPLPACLAGDCCHDLVVVILSAAACAGAAAADTNGAKVFRQAAEDTGGDAGHQEVLCRTLQTSNIIY